MITIIHRVNKIDQLIRVNKTYGVEVDVRCYKNNLVLNHDPYGNGENLDEYLKNYDHNILILNLKETGIEEEVIQKTKKYLNGKEFFLLDLEIPFIVTKGKLYKKYISVRFSEFETFETILKFDELADWIWIDTFTMLPKLNKNIISFLKTKKTCLVNPTRWGRDNELTNYITEFKRFQYLPDFLLS